MALDELVTVMREPATLTCACPAATDRPPGNTGGAACASGKPTLSSELAAKALARRLKACHGRGRGKCGSLEQGLRMAGLDADGGVASEGFD